MGLLQKIIEDATDGSAPVSQLLRSMQVLAVRAGAKDVEAWILRERDGYQNVDLVPAYRGPFPAIVVANFKHGYMLYQGQPLASTMFPEEFEEFFQTSFNQSIAEIEAIQPSMQNPWPAEAVHYANTLIGTGKVKLDDFVELLDVRRKVDPTRVSGITDAVRNRVLDLALKLERVAPELSEPEGQPSQNREQMSGAFQTIVYANTANIGNTENTQQQYNIQITPGNTESLARFLDGVGGIRDIDKTELLAAAEAAKLQGPQATEKDGRLKSALKKVGVVAGKVTQDVASLAVKAAIERYLGPAS